MSQTSQIAPASGEPDTSTPRVRVIGPYHTKPHHPGDFRDFRGVGGDRGE